MKIFVYLLAAVVVIVGGFMLYMKSLTCSKDVIDAAFNSFECHRMYMSFGLLFGILIVLIVSAGLYIFMPSDQANTSDKLAAKEVFDTISKGLLPIASLIIGFYFGVGSQKPDSQNLDKPSKPEVTNTDAKDKAAKEKAAAEKAAADKAAADKAAADKAAKGG